MARNPIPFVGTLTQGVGIEDAVAAIAGLALSTVVPGVIVKPAAAGGALTDTQRWMKVLTGVAVALAAGYGAEMVSRGSGKAAVLGGLAGAGVNAINVLKPGIISGPAALNPGVRSAIVRRSVSSPPQEEFASVTLG